MGCAKNGKFKDLFPEITIALSLSFRAKGSTLWIKI